MCGIVGIFPFNNLQDKQEQARKEAALFLFTELLQTTSARGEDATGVTTLFENGDYMIQKMGISSPKFISRFGNKASDFEGYTSLCLKNEKRIKALIGHCRKSSVGNTYDNENNHPIKAGEIVGIHNGTLKNHNKIFKNLECERDGVVDSEAIFRLIQHFTNDCKEPLTLNILEETVRRLDGSYSCLTYNANIPYQIGIFRDARPMEFALIKGLNLLVVASEKKFIDKALYDYNKYAKLYKTSFKMIKAADVSNASFLNNYVGIIDLTQKINKDTIINDLIIKKDVFKTEKIWKSTDVYDYYNRRKQVKNINTKSTNVTTTKTTGVTEKKSGLTSTSFAEGDTTKQSGIEGKIFCKELNKYIDPESVEYTSKIGCVEIANTGKKVLRIEENPIIDAEFMKVADVTPPKITTKEVDLNVDTDIIEGSKNSNDSLLKYKSNEDLAEDIEANDVKSVEALPAFALANRIRKHAYEAAFIDGATFYKKLDVNTKLDKLQKILKFSKKIIRILALNTELRSINNNNDQSKKYCMEECVREEDTKKELTTEDLNKLVSTGDKTDCKSLILLEKAIKEVNDGKAHTAGKI